MGWRCWITCFRNILNRILFRGRFCFAGCSFLFGGFLWLLHWLLLLIGVWTQQTRGLEISHFMCKLIFKKHKCILLLKWSDLETHSGDFTALKRTLFKPEWTVFILWCNSVIEYGDFQSPERTVVLLHCFEMLWLDAIKYVSYELLQNERGAANSRGRRCLYA